MQMELAPGEEKDRILNVYSDSEKIEHSHETKIQWPVVMRYVKE